MEVGGKLFDLSEQGVKKRRKKYSTVKTYKKEER